MVLLTSLSLSIYVATQHTFCSATLQRLCNHDRFATGSRSTPKNNWPRSLYIAVAVEAEGSERGEGGEGAGSDGVDAVVGEFEGAKRD